MTTTLPEFDAALAARCFTQLLPRLDALPGAEVPPARPDVRPLVAGALAAHAAAQPLRPRLERLPAEELDRGCADLVRDAAWALWHARAELDRALAPREPELPAALVEAALALKERMLRVCRYYLEDDEALAPALAALGRARKGHGELAADLRRLAALYRERHAVVSTDTKHFRAADPQEAEAAADAIGKALSEVGGEAIRLWTVRLARAQAFLLAVHEELRAAVLWLSRKEPGAAERWPSLASLPAPRGRPRKSPGAPVSEPPPAPPAEAQA